MATGPDRKIEVLSMSTEVIVRVLDESQTARSQSLAVSWAEARELRDLLIEATSD